MCQSYKENLLEEKQLKGFINTLVAFAERRIITMEIKKLSFEKKEVQIKETYIDETGKTRERIKKVMMPTGNVVPSDESLSNLSDKKNK